MDSPLITVCTVNYNSSEFIGNMLFSLSRLTQSRYRVIIRDNNSKKKDFNKLRTIIEKNNYNNVELYRVETSATGSLAHGEALNELVSKINTKYGVIIDADAAFLYKNWDQVLISKINEKNPVYGTQADIGGGKPEDFPLIFAVMFLTNIIRNLNINFKPDKNGGLKDTGWELREKCLSTRLSACLLYSFNTRLFKNGPFSSVVCSEYYLSDKAEGYIFASHFGRGSSPKSKKLVQIDTKGNVFLRFLNKMLQFSNIIKWQRDKSKWIKICYDIIVKQ